MGVGRPRLAGLGERILFLPERAAMRLNLGLNLVLGFVRQVMTKSFSRRAVDRLEFSVITDWLFSTPLHHTV